VDVPKGDAAEPDSESNDPSSGPQPVDQRLLDEIFGDVLPDTTGDERSSGTSGGFSEEWYRDNRPPHHGD
jgi:hypothetical protein